MLDINKVYVTLYRDNTTGHVSGDNPRMKPFLATNAMIDYRHGETCLAFWAIGDERGHLLEGTIIRELENGIVFNAQRINETLTLTEFTMQEFEQRCRPDMERFEPGSTRELRTIQDVYAFCRRGVPTIQTEEQEEQHMKLTKADIDKVRHIEGFPIARDEDIIALSRPPYYTACPNPFIEDFIREHGTPYDEATDDYHREPFAADVSEGKNDPIYMAHSYHTKVPHKAIMRYILHYTNPGDVVLDGFCGTGMTGVAADLCGNPDPAFKATVEMEMPDRIRWGSRLAILSDLSPAATFISYNYNHHVDARSFEETAQRALQHCEAELGWLYETQHVDEKGNPIIGITGKPIMGRINYVIWSDVLICPSCSNELIFYDAAIDKAAGVVRDQFSCPICHSSLKKTDCARAQVSLFDMVIGRTITVAKQVPVEINYSVGTKRFKKVPDSLDIEINRRIENYEIPYFVPVCELPAGANTEQPRKSHGVEYTYQFYTKRNLLAMSKFMDEAKGSDLLKFMLTSININVSRLYRYRTNGKGGNLSGTLYICSTPQENNVFVALQRKIADIMGMLSRWGDSQVYCNCASTTDLATIPSASIDYIFTDPPFGGNLNYSELNCMWESWIGVFTDNKSEAIINAVQKKGLAEYQGLMERCFTEYYRVLKPNRWITIEFHNSQNSVWSAIQEAIMRAGFIVADVRTLDKKQGSFKQVTSVSAVKQDLVISAYKPKESFVRDFQSHAGDPEMAWEFVRQHLKNVPITADGNRDGKLDIIAERQEYLLFDRMVAWHIMNGIPVPMDSHTFYDGLRQRFLERDGMFFLPDQVTEYDDKRAHMELDVQQMSFLVTDEKNAIAWLNYILAQGPKTYQEIQPLYLQELHQSKQEKMPELLDMLKENFVQDEKGAWYIPDLNNAADLAKVRRKTLLKEFFDSCVPGKGKLKVFRMEAIRAGFDECWKQRDYATIVSVGERLPEAALQEDQTLLMYYDNACSRV